MVKKMIGSKEMRNTHAPFKHVLRIIGHCKIGRSLQELSSFPVWNKFLAPWREKA